MNDISYDLTALILTYSLSIISLILIPISIIIAIIFFKQTKNKFILPSLALILCFLSLLVWLSVPLTYLHKAFLSYGDKPKEHKYYTLAAQTAIIPSVKGKMYSQLADFEYLNLNDGPSAIKNYENAYSYTKSYEGTPVCYLYAVKGDYKKAMPIYLEKENYKGLATNYYLIKDYPKAIEAVNKSIKNSKSRFSDIEKYRLRAAIYKKMGKNNLAKKDIKTAFDIVNAKVKNWPKDCWSYEQRAVIYNDMGQISLAKKDYNKAVSLCPQNFVLKDDFKNKTVTIEEFYNRQRKKLGF